MAICSNQLCRARYHDNQDGQECTADFPIFVCPDCGQELCHTSQPIPATCPNPDCREVIQKDKVRRSSRKCGATIKRSYGSWRP